MQSPLTLVFASKSSSTLTFEEEESIGLVSRWGGDVKDDSRSLAMNNWVVPFPEMEMPWGRVQDGWQAESYYWGRVKLEISLGYCRSSGWSHKCRHHLQTPFLALHFHRYSDPLTLRAAGQEGLTWTGNADQEGTGARAPAWTHQGSEVKNRKRSQQT